MILIAIALFAALSFAVSGMLGGGQTSAISDDKAGIHATEILDYAATIRRAVQTMRIDGCADTEISFENDFVSGYTNGTNTSCQVFHPNGGGINWQSPATGLNDGSEWVFTGDNYMDNVGVGGGGDNSELTMVLPNVNETVCLAINEKLALETTLTPPQDANCCIRDTVAYAFTGTYGGSASGVWHSNQDFQGVPNVCALKNNGTDHVFIQTLIAR